MSSKADGLVTAIDDLSIDQIEHVAEQQAELFGGFGPALISTDLNDPEVVRTGRPGRPKGAKNKNTKEWSSYILEKYQSPLIFLAETYSRPVGVLAKELCCDRLEAFKVQCASAGKLAEYVHQKQPIALTVDHKSAGTLVINTGLPANDGPKAGVLGSPTPPDNIVINQQVTDLKEIKSDDEKSDDG